MSKLKIQFVTTFSFIVALIGLALFVLSTSNNSKEYKAKELKTYYLENPEIKTVAPEEQPSVFSLIKKAAGFEKEMSYLMLFQNNLELRPTGGFVSSFATAKIESAKPKDFQFYDTAVFDIKLSTPTQIEPPEPINKYLFVKNWQFRDGNWSPDFPTAAQKMIEFYHAQGGQEQFDGVIAITPEVLGALLELHGPVELPDYGLTVNKDNFLLTLEKQVEIDFKDQGIARTDRKNILKDLAQILIDKTIAMNPLKSLKLISIGSEHLENKDILLYFTNPEIQKDVQRLGWSGEIKQISSDYVFVVDANVNAFKADYFIERSLRYDVDLSSATPKARLTINYSHGAEQKSWLVRDYQSWLRVYTPEGSWFTNISGLSTDPQYGKEFGKTFMAGLVKVPLSSDHAVVLEYDLPQNIKTNEYGLLIQKQPGIDELPVEISVTFPDKTQKNFKETITGDKGFTF
ncbi:MAG: DUF4012 domain-containing protein [Candidatus Paceibacterota bacterium]|jgi:hypothetical protein